MSAPAIPAATWIARRADLDAWLARMPADAVIGVDTEFMRTHTYYAQLALLQLGWDGQYALVDPLAFDLADALRGTLGTRSMVTVMHSASEDLETLAPALPAGPGTLFDTQLAAAFVGMGLGASYRTLVQELAGVELEKAETRSNWLQRPLTAAQCTYAALDVVYLRTLHEQLAARLAERGRSAWHAEDCARLCRRATDTTPDPQPQRTLHAIADWSPAHQALVRRILLWRDRAARALDVPRPWLVDDAHVLDLAHALPETLAALEQRCRGQRALRAAQRAELFGVLTAPVDDAEIAATVPALRHAHGGDKQALGAMKQEVDRLAGSLDLPAGLLCPRKVLEGFVVTARWPALLEGWRRDVLHERLTSLLPDQAGAAPAAV